MADRNLEAVVDMEHSTIRQNGHTTAVRAFPISIDFEAHSQQAQSPAVSKAMNRWSERLGNPDFLGIGVDRIDYTKGLPEKLKGIDLLFHRHPEYAGRLVFAQVGVPSRTAISDYGRLNQQILDFVNELNAKWRRGSWQPVHFIHQHVDMPEMMALHRLADFCAVTSLHDGMNLVAKEFVSSRFDEDGVLVLSSFTGAARELNTALSVNPFAPDDIADAMHQALIMSPAEKTRRMQRMRTAVESNNIYRWAGKILEHALRVESDEPVVEDLASIMAIGAA